MPQLVMFPSIVHDEVWLESVISPLYPELWRIVRQPFDDLLTRRATDRAFRIMDEGETAQWLRPQIVDLARQIFDGHPDVRIERRKQQFFMNYKDAVAITPKKIRSDRDRKGLTFSSYDTRQNMDYWGRREVDGLPMLPRLIVGYQFVAEMTDIKIYVGYPYGKRVRVYLLVPDQSGAILGVHQPPPEDSGAEEDPGFRVVAKKRKNRNKDDRELG